MRSGWNLLRIGLALTVAAAVVAIMVVGPRAVRQAREATGQRIGQLSRSLSDEVTRQEDVEEQELLQNIRAWTSRQAETVEVEVRIERRDPVVVRPADHPAPQGDEPTEAQITLSRRGGEWAVLTLRLFAAQDGSALSRMIQRLSGDLFGVTVAGAIVLVVILRTSHSRARGMPNVWSQARSRVMETLDFLAEGVLVLDPSSRIVFANRALCELVGIPLSGLVGRSTSDLNWHRPDDEPDAELPWARVFANPSAPAQGRVLWRRDSDTQLVLNVTCRSIAHARRVRGVLVTLDDVSMLEEQREQLRAARDAADSANRAKSMFLANMSHEIRTPINGVTGTLELLASTQLHSRQRRYVAAASQSAAALLHLINDILDLSKIEAGKLELCEDVFDLERCIQSAMEIVAGAAAAKEIELVLFAGAVRGLRLRGDPDRFRQILINLVNNAVKFTDRGEVVVTVSTRTEVDGKQRVEVAVRDTGVGIPADRLDRLFRTFSQVDSSPCRKNLGTGLGLAICRQLCGLMGGGVTVQSKENEGSTFTFHVALPRTASDDAPAGESAAVQAEILIWEPSVTARRAAAEALESVGITARFFESPGPLVDHLESPRQRDAVVLLGAVTWGEAQCMTAQHIRRRPDPRRILIGSCLSEPAPDTELPANAAPDGWLQKPFTPTSLVFQLQEALSRGSPQSASAAADELERLLRGKRILVAEDNAVGQMVTSGFLASLGCICEIVDRGDAVLPAIQRGAWDALLLDCHLPGLDGFEAAQQLRLWEERTGRPHLPIVALTAAAMAGDKERCFAAGMDGYITKPVQRATVAKALVDAMGGRAMAASSPANMAEAAEPEQTIEAARPPSGGSEMPPLNLPALKNRCMKREDMMLELLALFAQSTQDDLSKLSAAIERGIPGDIGDVAHGIAGSALQVEAGEMSRLARAVENSAKTDVEAIHDQVKDLIEECKRAAAYAQETVVHAKSSE